MSDVNNLKISSIEELVEQSKGEVIELPGFQNGVPFVARLKRPSLLGLIKAGKIPNELLNEANKLFVDGPGGVVRARANTSPEVTSDLFTLLEVICEVSFVEPKYDDLRKAGIELTDAQYMAVFSYTQNGVEALKSFH